MMKKIVEKFGIRIRFSLSIMVLFLCTIFLFLSNNVNAEQTGLTIDNVPTHLVSGALTTETITIPLASGQTNVYEISTISQLRALSSYVMQGNNCAGKTFNLINNLDFSNLSSDYNLIYDLDGTTGNESNFFPIGGWKGRGAYDYTTDERYFFKGIFNGNNNTITGVKTLKDEYSYYVGLFGYCEGATINDININNATIQGHNYVGLLVGQTNSNTNINNCSVSNSTVKDGYDYVGGVVGYNLKSIISNCSSNNVTISGSSTDIGGIAGRNENSSSTNSKINNCYVRNGNITITSNTGIIGGICGINNSYAQINNCYITSTNVKRETTSSTAGQSIGGICGQNINSLQVNNCYSAATVINKATQVYNCIGVNNSSATVTNCYYNNGTTTDGNVGTTTGTGKSSANMKLPAFVTTLNSGVPNYQSDILFGENYGYPIFTT